MHSYTNNYDSPSKIKAPKEVWTECQEKEERRSCLIWAREMGKNEQKATVSWLCGWDKLKGWVY